MNDQTPARKLTPIQPSVSQAQQDSALDKDKPPKKKFIATSKGKIIIAIVAVFVLFGILSAQVYYRPVTDGFVRKMARFIPYPALSVNGKIVTMKEFLIEYDALLNYFNDLDKEPPAGDQLEVSIADTLINKIAIQELAKKYGVTLDEDQVNAYYDKIVASQDSKEAFEQNLSDTFGWTPDEFRERIVKSIVLTNQVTDMVLHDEDLQAPRVELVNSAYDRVQGGEDFSTVASDVNSGFTGIESDLGYVKASMMPDTWADQVKALAEGETTNVIALDAGYVIFKLEEKIEAGEDTQFHLLSITVPKVTLEDLVDEYIKSAKIKRYVGEK